MQPSVRTASFALCAGALLTIAPAFAQASKTERRVYARLLELRRALAVACADAPRERVREVARLCSSTDLAVRPLASTADLVRRARGAESDAAASLRGGMHTIVVPEVADLAAFESIYVTLRLARSHETDQRVTFHCSLLDATGEVVREVAMLEPKGVADLLRVAATTTLDVRGLADGRYVVQVEPFVGEEGVLPFEVPLQAPLRIDRSYKARLDEVPLYLDPFHPDSATRGEAAAAALAQLADTVDTPAERAAYATAYFAVDRAFRGEPPLPGVDAITELDHLDRILQNAAEDRDPYDGIHGRLTIGIPVELPKAVTDAIPHQATGLPTILATEHVRVSVELPEPKAAGESQPQKPLLIVLPGTPTWDGATDRPSAQRGVPPEWTVAELAALGIGADQSFHIAVVEGLGRMPSPIHALPQLTRALRERLAIGDAPIVWVGEREGAFVVCRALLADPDLATSVLLVNGGSLSNAELEQIGAAQVFVAPSVGHASEPTIMSLVERGDERVRLVDGADLRPWPIALPLAIQTVMPLIARARSTAR